MKKRLLILTLATVAVSTGLSPNVVNAQIASTAAGATRVAQQHLIGEVTAIDQAAGLITIKTDAGASVTVTVNPQTTYRRMPPGQTSLAKAETITSADVKVGDRVLVPSGATLAAGTAARQVIVMAREAVAARRDQQREDWRTRGMNGRVLTVDAAKKEITMESRTRDSAQTLTVVTNNSSRIRRFAPGSLRPDDAVAGNFADIRVGDQIRVLGNREEFRVTAEEIISGTVARMLGTLEKVDLARNEIVVKDTQTGKSTVISFLPATTLRRVPADFAETMRQGQQRRGEDANLTEAQRTAQREQRAARRRERETQGATATPPQGGQAGAQTGGQNPNGPQRAGGRNPQQMFENFPVITAAELKKGDAIMVVGTGASDARVMAATVVTGNAEILELLQRRTGGRPQGMSPGLPSGVMGGGTGSEPDRPQPATPPRR
jgi:sRNA-binding protein